MSTCLCPRRFAVVASALVLFSPSPVAAQDPAPVHDMQHMSHETHSSIPERDGSGTAWLPDDSPMYALHWNAGDWMLMGHGSAFLQYLHETSERGGTQTGSINWLMGMASGPLAGGRLELRGMASLEPWTIGGCGYPDLLATGEICAGAAIHDRQHPHDLFMEIAAVYEHPLSSAVRLQIYGGPVGEPALGPVAFPHRISATPNPLAPITHHWLDATHISYGVVTAGLYGDQWKAEASAFNGREPDEQRTDLDGAALDSWAGRFWLLPTKALALQVSAGHLKDAEAGHEGGPRIDVTRVTASATYHKSLRGSSGNSIWATTVAWGRNAERDHDATTGVLAETAVMLGDRESIFGRFEVSRKSGFDLAVDTGELFTVSKLQGGYTRYVAEWGGLKTGLGVAASVGFVPTSLEAIYGSRANIGVGLFITMRPAARQR